ncbi:aminopeptidase N isoform X2 [Chrysoperla carnea]|uniref:aminopeptidase N isoform X2 n=1 Tax=Chrysoperla carnea TaxID=189513 RepID=UPI001D075AB0|nr:aminopeptidase N isoform X2 [Chrysoperla carnea]
MSWQSTTIAILILACIGYHQINASALMQQRNRRSIDLNAAHMLISDARLDKAVIPTAYKLEFTAEPEEGKFNGVVWINVTWLEPSDEIKLHVHQDLQVTQAVAIEPKLKTENVRIVRTERIPKKPLYVLHLEKSVEKGTDCQLQLSFSGQLSNETSEGVFRTSFADKTSNECKWFVATHMRPNNARRVFPCFDEPSFKTPFELKLARPKSMMALSNMPLSKTTDMENREGWVWDTFQTTPPMSTFTLGFVIGELHNIESGAVDNGVNVKIYGRRDYLEPLKDVPNRTRRVVKELQSYWGLDFPLKKLDIVALPNYYAVRPADNWGLIFFKESELSRTGVWQIAQEITYQWLGALATPYWWSDAHINKALASYMAAWTAFKIDNGAELQGKWPMTILYSLYYEFSKRYPHARITGMKYETTASKTELIFRMFNYTLGETTFRQALRKFIREKEYKTFFGDDIWSALTEQAHTNRVLCRQVSVNEIAGSWITKDRLPVVTVTRDYKKNSAVLKQRVYLRDRPHDVPDQDKMLWWIPIVLVDEEKLDFHNYTPRVWMKKEREIEIKDLPKENQFIIVNPEEIGPFPVNYDIQNWNMLAQYLLNNQEGRSRIPVYTRAKLLHDAWNLAYAGDLSFATALNMTLFLKYERDHLAWDPVFTMIDHIGRHIDSSEVHKKFETYVRMLLTPLYEELGSEPKPDEDRSQTHLRGLAKVFLCRAGYKPCIEEAQAVYKKWMESEDPDEGNPVANQFICPVFKWGTREEWEFGLQRVINFPPSRKQSERTYLLKTLVGCPIESWKIDRILNITILEDNGNFTETDIYLIFSMLTGGASGYTTLFHFLKNNWEIIKVRFENKPHLWDSIITSATNVFTTQEGLDMVSELYVQRQGEFGTAEYIIEKALRNIKEETKWSDENLPVIEKWVDNYLEQQNSEEKVKFLRK